MPVKGAARQTPSIRTMASAEQGGGTAAQFSFCVTSDINAQVTPAPIPVLVADHINCISNKEISSLDFKYSRYNCA